MRSLTERLFLRCKKFAVLDDHDVSQSPVVSAVATVNSLVRWFGHVLFTKAKYRACRLRCCIIGMLLALLSLKQVVSRTDLDTEHCVVRRTFPPQTATTANEELIAIRLADTSILEKRRRQHVVHLVSLDEVCDVSVDQTDNMNVRCVLPPSGEQKIEMYVSILRVPTTLLEHRDVNFECSKKLANGNVIKRHVQMQLLYGSNRVVLHETRRAPVDVILSAFSRVSLSVLLRDVYEISID